MIKAVLSDIFFSIKKLSATFFMVAMAISVSAQSGWKYSGNFNFGCNIVFYYSKAQTFPGLRLYAAFIANAVYNNGFIVNYGPSVSIYNKCLGANLNPLTNDIQIDFINSISFGGGGDPLPYFKYLRTVGNGTCYNLMLNEGYAGMVTSNFIVNNHNRNQVNADVTISTPYATLNYYNDGGWPIPFPFSDNFDRYWTGGGGIFIHNDRGFNPVELTFDQFTGYKPFLYELATDLGFDIPNYNAEDPKNGKISQQFNTSEYNLRISPSLGYGIDIGVIGSLKTNKGVYWGIQDIIHTLGGYALHPNYDINRYYIGGSYNNFNNVSFAQ